jgi:NAD-dependent deacetylase
MTAASYVPPIARKTNVGTVYPAAGFVAEARACGVRTCEINLEAADNADLFDEQRLGPASTTVPAWVEEVVGE